MTEERNVSVIRRPNNEITAQRSYDGKQLRLIRNTVARDTTQDEFDMFTEICKRQGLDPFRRQIYAIVYNKDDAKKRKVAFITGIDGYRAIAKRSGTYRPCPEEPDITYSDDAKCETNPLGIVKAVVTVFQYAVDGWYPVVGTANWDEFAPVLEEKEWVDVLDDQGNPVLQTDGKWAGRPKRELRFTGKKTLNNANWTKMPQVMIAKCAEAQALRKGWPEEIGGLYVSEEMHRMESDIIASEAIEIFEEQERLKKVKAYDTIPMILSQSEGMEAVDTGKMFDTVMSVVRDIDDLQELEFWLNRNRLGLQEYWAKCKSDAIALKAEIEKHQEYLKNKPVEE